MYNGLKTKLHITFKSTHVLRSPFHTSSLCWENISLNIMNSKEAEVEKVIFFFKHLLSALSVRRNAQSCSAHSWTILQLHFQASINFNEGLISQEKNAAPDHYRASLCRTDSNWCFSSLHTLYSTNNHWSFHMTIPLVLLPQLNYAWCSNHRHYRVLYAGCQ